MIFFRIELARNNLIELVKSSITFIHLISRKTTASYLEYTQKHLLMVKLSLKILHFKYVTEKIPISSCSDIVSEN